MRAAATSVRSGVAGCSGAHVSAAAASAATIYWGGLRSYPEHALTGTRGYFGKALSSRDFRHIVNTEPRPLRTRRW
jgi:hypothetical protein